MKVLTHGEPRVVEGGRMAFVDRYERASFSLFWLDHTALARLQICPLRASSIGAVEVSWVHRERWRQFGPISIARIHSLIDAPPLLRRHPLLPALLPSPFVTLHRSGYHQLRPRHSLLHSLLLRAISDLSAQLRS